MKKHLFFFIIAISLLVMSSHVRGQGVDLRSVVAVVRVNNCESSKTFLKEYGAMLRKDGYTEGADWIESYIEGGFGSGFTYQDPVTKKYYIITNRHVVAFSENVTVEFVEKDKSVVKYEQCPVVAIHDEMDIAIVALPDSVQRSSLLFSQQVLKEGVDVFTAGYPGLGGYPSWQFGMGIISNARFYSPIFADYKDIPLIQHTAQADAGSSGGPLLVKSPESQNSYLVVGINTWKIHAIKMQTFPFRLNMQWI